MEVSLGSLMRDQGDIIKPSNYFGIYRGFIKDNNDPEKRGRLRIYVPNIHPEDIKTPNLPWAEHCSPDGGGPDRGMFLIPDADDTVWMMFEFGDKNFPVWIGTWWGYPSNQSEAPAESRDGATYPKKRVLYKSRAGAIIEINDEAGKEKIRIADKEGNEFIYDTVEKGLEINAVKQLTINTGDDCNINVGANFNITVGGNYSESTDGSKICKTSMQVINKATNIQNQMG